MLYTFKYYNLALSIAIYDIFYNNFRLKINQYFNNFTIVQFMKFDRLIES